MKFVSRDGAYEVDLDILPFDAEHHPLEKTATELSTSLGLLLLVTFLQLQYSSITYHDSTTLDVGVFRNDPNLT